MLDEMWKELVKNESEGTIQEAEVERKGERATGSEALGRLACRVTAEVLHAGHKVGGAKHSRHTRVLKPAQQQHRDHARQKLQRVLVRPLHAVERLRLLAPVLLLIRVHGRVWHIVLPASTSHLHT